MQTNAIQASPVRDETLRKGIALRPASARSRIWLLMLTAVLPTIITAVALGVVLTQPGFQDAPPSITRALAGTALCVVAVAFALSRLMRRHSLRLDSDSLEITTTFYRRRFSIDQLDLAKARVIDLAEHTAFKPIMKTNAMIVPGFNSGWFRLRNRERAFVATSDGPRVLLIPTHAKFNLLLQPMQPQVLLDSLRDIAVTRAAR